MRDKATRTHEPGNEVIQNSEYFTHDWVNPFLRYPQQNGMHVACLLHACCMHPARCFRH